MLAEANGATAPSQRSVQPRGCATTPHTVCPTASLRSHFAASKQIVTRILSARSFSSARASAEKLVAIDRLRGVRSVIPAPLPPTCNLRPDPGPCVHLNLCGLFSSQVVERPQDQDLEHHHHVQRLASGRGLALLLVHRLQQQPEQQDRFGDRRGAGIRLSSTLPVGDAAGATV